MEVNHRKEEEKEKQKLNFPEKNNFSSLDSFGLSFKWFKGLEQNKGYEMEQEPWNGTRAMK